MLPISVIGFIMQLIPILLRIGWTGENPKVPVAFIYISAIIYNFNIDGTLLNALHNENGNLFSMNELRGFKLSANSGSGTTYFNFLNLNPPFINFS